MLNTASLTKKQQVGALTMNLVIRSQESRRLNPTVGFPFVDGDGVLVLRDRRIQPNRRKARYGLDDLKVILSKMSGR